MEGLDAAGDGRSALRRYLGRWRLRLRQFRQIMLHYRNRGRMLRAMLGSAPVPTAVLRDGTRVHTPELRTLLSAVDEVYARELYTPRGMKLEPGDLVVDVGAHIGLFAMYAARRCRGPVYAIEPSAGNFAYLKRNIAANDLENVVAIHAAVDATSGESVLLRGRHSVGHSLVADAEAGSGVGGSERVRTITLASLFENHPINRIDFLKLDCEGAEGVILETAGRDVLDRICAIAVEFHDGWSRLDHRQIAALLDDAGFAVSIARRGGSRFGYVYASKRSAGGHRP